MPITYPNAIATLDDQLHLAEPSRYSSVNPQTMENKDYKIAKSAVIDETASVLGSDTSYRSDNSNEKPPLLNRRKGLWSLFPTLDTRKTKPKQRTPITPPVTPRWAVQERRLIEKPLVIASIALVPTIILLPLFIYYVHHLQSLISRNDVQKTVASWGITKTPQSDAHLPADFSRNINPIACHSHNDYWREIPLYDAIAAGCTGVEADVWLTSGELFVGHNKKSLTSARTLKSLYIDPIVNILTLQNPSDSSSPHGVFDTSPSTPLTLLIDMKTDGADALPVVLQQLEPLRSRGWLTHFNGTDVVPGLVTVVGTDKTPFDTLKANKTLDVFYDAPLDHLFGDDPPADSRDYTSSNSYYASVSFSTLGDLYLGMVTPDQIRTIRGQVAEAKKRGLVARYWDTPAWPIGVRNHVWDVLEREGVGMLNVDDLEAACKRSWKT